MVLAPGHLNEPSAPSLTSRKNSDDSLPINLILNITHSNKSRNNAIPPARLHPRRNSPIMHILGTRDPRPAIIFGEEKRDFTAVFAGVHDVAFVDDPVVSRGVAVVVCGVGEDAVVGGEGVLCISLRMC